MPINYEALRNGSATAEVPADGNHQARLERAALVDTARGERLVTEWATINPLQQWTSWNRFDTAGLAFTRDLLTGLGILDDVTSDTALANALERVTGQTFEVRTQSNKGAQGDRWFTHTYVDGPALGVQETMDAPFDTTDLPPPNRAAVEDDTETIPF
jgi:hypothetical protein